MHKELYEEYEQMTLHKSRANRGSGMAEHLVKKYKLKNKASLYKIIRDCKIYEEGYVNGRTDGYKMGMSEK
jgi:hypothetical protein